MRSLFILTKYPFFSRIAAERFDFHRTFKTLTTTFKVCFTKLNESHPSNLRACAIPIVCQGLEANTGTKPRTESVKYLCLILLRPITVRDTKPWGYLDNGSSRDHRIERKQETLSQKCRVHSGLVNSRVNKFDVRAT